MAPVFPIGSIAGMAACQFTSGEACDVSSVSEYTKTIIGL